ncbi:hypothetical protein BSKO_13742 [Bryopsis sp. KO-2023]|nr:hypothetical protein BSKO_13742 [Bryopsis sp. KO-2023]
MNVKRKRGQGAGGRGRAAPQSKKKKIDNFCVHTNSPEFVGRVTRSRSRKAESSRLQNDRGPTVSGKTSEGTTVGDSLKLLSCPKLNKPSKSLLNNGGTDWRSSRKQGAPATGTSTACEKSHAGHRPQSHPESGSDDEPACSFDYAADSVGEDESLGFPWERAGVASRKKGALGEVNDAGRNPSFHRLTKQDAVKKGCETEEMAASGGTGRAKRSAECGVIHRLEASPTKVMPRVPSGKGREKEASKPGSFPTGGTASTGHGKNGLKSRCSEQKEDEASGKSTIKNKPTSKSVISKPRSPGKKYGGVLPVRSVTLKPKSSGKRSGVQSLGMFFPSLNDKSAGVGSGKTKNLTLTLPKQGDKGKKKHSGGTSTGKLTSSSSQTLVQSVVPSATVVGESGVNLLVLDSAVYALDGLKPGCGVATQRANAMSILTIVSDRKSRNVLQAANLVKNGIMRGFASVLGSGDPVLALSCAYTISALAQPSADLSLFASKEVMVVVKFLLRQDLDCVSADGDLVSLVKSDSQASVNSERVVDGPTKDLLKVMTGGALSSSIPEEEIGNPCSVALAALCMAIDGNVESPMMDGLKESMVANGVADVLCDRMVECWNLCPLEPDSALIEGSVADVSRALWKVEYCMDILTCMTNSTGPCQQHLIKKRILGCNDSIQPMLFPSFVASRFSAIRSKFPELVSNGQFNSLQGILGLLMNLGHGDLETAEMLCSHGVVEGCGELLALCCSSEGPIEKQVDASKSDMQDVVDLTGAPSSANIWSNSDFAKFKSVVVKSGSSLVSILGLLINLCEKSEKNSKTLISMALPSSMRSRYPMNGGVLELLSLIIRAVDARAAYSALEREKLDSADLTRICAAVLLGYLIENKGGLQKSVAKCFPKGNLESIVDSIQLLLRWSEGKSSPVVGCDRGALQRIVRKFSTQV